MSKIQINNGILPLLREIVRDSQQSTCEITIHVKGAMISGIVRSFPAHQIDRYSDAKSLVEPGNERRIQMIEGIIEKFSADFDKIELNAEGVEIIVIEDAEIRYGTHAHNSPVWIGNISAIDGFEYKSQSDVDAK